jgi:hypothetical protein
MKNALIGILTAFLLVAVGVREATAAAQASDRLTLDQARLYMLELINRDRASKGLNPVKLDATATLAGQKHAEEMASERYLSHSSLEGKMPDQRYTEAGGTDSVHENVFLQTRGKRAGRSGSLTLLSEPTFTKREIEEMEAAYFNEIPPNDGHRRNILNPQRTHVGIGLARAWGDGMISLANTQEFVDRYVEAEPLPQTLPARSALTVGGRTPPGTNFVSVSLSRGPLPSRMSVEELERTRGYSVPASFVSYWPEPYVSPQPVEITADGRFKAVIRASDLARPGLYYVSIWVRQGLSGDFIASQRTVVVR